MATVVRNDKDGRTFLHTWNLTSADPTGDSMSAPGSADRSIQFVATTAGSATAALQGSNVESPSVDSDWIALTDGQGNAISFTASGVEMVAENMLHYRTILTTAGSGAVWIALLFSRSTMR